MATTAQQQRRDGSLAIGDTVTLGAIAGVASGSVFGIWMLGAANMFPTIASMIGSDSVVIGFILHMIISAVIGGSFGFVAPRIPNSLPLQVTGGFVWGLVWWVLGALIIMQTVLMGAPFAAFGEPQLASLVGHMIFGILLGTFYVVLRSVQLSHR